MAKLPRSCAICFQVHAYGTKCPVAAANYERNHPKLSVVERFGTGWAAKSKRVLQRDHYQCQLRLPGCQGRATTADHIVPRSRGGTSDLANLVSACRHCNSAKGNR